ncbi:MAG: NAD(P)H-dependent oxidoreductase [Nitrospira sp.]|nr:NAD(P)H-dependent oxidoreductase [Nitrospira sp.]
MIEVARLEFPLLRTKAEFEHGVPSDSIKQAQDAIRWADHLVIVYPLWLGSMPALLKAFFEQVFRPGNAFGISSTRADGRSPRAAGAIVADDGSGVAHCFSPSLKSALSLFSATYLASAVSAHADDPGRRDRGLNERQRATWLDRLRALGDAGQ